MKWNRARLVTRNALASNVLHSYTCKAHSEVVHGDCQRIHDLSINGVIFQIYQIHLLPDLRRRSRRERLWAALKGKLLAVVTNRYTGWLFTTESISSTQQLCVFKGKVCCHQNTSESFWKLPRRTAWPLVRWDSRNVPNFLFIHDVAVYKSVSNRSSSRSPEQVSKRISQQKSVMTTASS